MDGGSWTNSLSWVQGYDNCVGPMEEASALFYERSPAPPAMLFHLMASQTEFDRRGVDPLRPRYLPSG